jgi:DNA-binding response OmpR family regulator
MPKLLVVDDDPVIVELLRVNFEMEGFEVVSGG